MEKICENCMSRVPVGTDKCPKCGIRFENTNPGGALPNGWVLGGRYTVGRYMDLDGEGVTYAAIDGNTLQRVLIKEYMPVTLCANRDETGAILCKPGCEVLFKTTRMDYAELFSILMRMGLVEGLSQVLDVLEENNTAYAVLEMVEGPTLSEYLRRQSEPLEVARALAMLRPVLIGTEAMHAANVVHRGISPDNIILESGGTAKLTGYATLALRQQGSELKPKLYPGFSAPEQYSASEFEGRYTDVYALGAVLFRMITGEEPVSADERKIQDTQPAARSVDKEVPSYLSTAITRAMKIQPSERIQSIAELRLAFSGEAKKSPRSGGGVAGLSRQQMIVGGIAIGVVVLLLLVVLLVSLFGGGSRGDDTSSISASQSNTIPDFTGMVYEDVRSDSRYSHFTFAEPTYEFSASIAEGKVIRQTPTAGSDWDGSTGISLVVSQGPQRGQMPNLVGQNKDAAVVTLEAMGITPTLQTEKNDGSYSEGEVVRTDPVAGTTVDAGSQVTLYVADKATSVKMPNLNSLDEEEAKKQLDELNILYTMVYEKNDGSYEPRKVLETSKKAGEEVSLLTDRVEVKVADYVAMPDITGMTEEQAREVFEKLRSSTSKLDVTLNFNRYPDSRYPDNVVYNTTRNGGGVLGIGDPLKNGDVIDVVIYYTPSADEQPAASDPANEMTLPPIEAEEDED